METDQPQAAEPAEDECKLCQWVFVAVGAAVGLALLYMAADVALGGRITRALAAAPAQLAPVVDLPRGDDEHTG
jgi:hypothetical protein